MRWPAAILTARLAVAAVVALGLGAVLRRAQPAQPADPLYATCRHGAQWLDECLDCPGGIPAVDESADLCSYEDCPHPAHWTDPVITRGDLDDWGRQ